MFRLLQKLILTPTSIALIVCFSWIAIIPVVLLCCRQAIRLLSWQLHRRNDTRRRLLLNKLDIREHEKRRTVVGFFHPYCNAGGGGERVLWTAIAYMQSVEPDVVCVVYTGDVDVSKTEIIGKVANRFSITLDPATLAFVYLKKRHLVEDTTWPRFTLLGQSIGSAVLGYEALARLIPDVFIDTMGYAFATSLAKLLTCCAVGAYIHYPTISSSMVQRVKARAAGHTNQSAVAASSILTYCKLLYYIVFTELYSLSLRQVDYTMVNSTWTRGHIQRLLQPLSHRDDETPSEGPLRFGKRAHVVYPPCDVHSLAQLPIETREMVILSIAQFRPEKEHVQQLRALRTFLDNPGNSRFAGIKLIMAGSVRNTADENRVAELEASAELLDLGRHTKFILNASYPELIELYGIASIGLSTMVEEHFGINVVEMMAAGLIPIVHASGGPLLDIVVADTDGRPTGFHAQTPEEYAKAFSRALSMSSAEQTDVRKRARARALAEFSAASFERGWQRAWDHLKLA